MLGLNSSKGTSSCVSTFPHIDVLSSFFITVRRWLIYVLQHRVHPSVVVIRWLRHRASPGPLQKNHFLILSFAPLNEVILSSLYLWVVAIERDTGVCILIFDRFCMIYFLEPFFMRLLNCLRRTLASWNKTEISLRFVERDSNVTIRISSNHILTSMHRGGGKRRAGGREEGKKGRMEEGKKERRVGEMEGNRKRWIERVYRLCKYLTLSSSGTIHLWSIQIFISTSLSSGWYRIR